MAVVIPVVSGKHRQKELLITMKAEDKAASRAKTMSIYGEMVPEASGRKPGMGRLDEFSRSNLRQPRTNSKGEDDSPVGNVTSGSLTVALGKIVDV